MGWRPENVGVPNNYDSLIVRDPDGNEVSYDHQKTNGAVYRVVFSRVDSLGKREFLAKKDYTDEGEIRRVSSEKDSLMDFGARRHDRCGLGCWFD